MIVLKLNWRNFHALIATFRELRDLIAVSCFEVIIDEDEFMLLWDFNSSKNLDFPYEDYGRFELDEVSTLFLNIAVCYYKLNRVNDSETE